MNKFQLWLEEFGGDSALAKKLRVTNFVVRRWRKGQGWPRVAYILKIVSLSKGQLTVDDVIKYTYLKKYRG